MFNKTIFGQTLRSNFKVWIILTAVLSAFNVVLIAVFDPDTINSMASMVEGTPLDNILGSSSFLGMLSQTYFSLQGVLLGLIFIVVTANSVIVSKVDKGSMAYLLSTPVKRSKVVRTQAAYMILMVFLMFAVSTAAGLISVEAFHGGVFSKVYTEDVKAASEVLGEDQENVESDLNLILDDKKALKAGAEARNMEEDEYTAYLNLKITNNAYEAAADKMDVDVEEIEKEPAIIKDNGEALAAAAKIAGMDKASYSNYLDQLTAEKGDMEKQSQKLQDQLLAGVTAGSETLKMEESDLLADMGKLKSDDKALAAAVKASGLPEKAFLTMVNSQIAASAVSADKGIDFHIDDYLMLNLGLFLLMFATSAISFLFSCVFNLTKNYIALGAGIPIAFFLFHMMGQVSESLDGMKYVTMNSLFDTQAVLDGEGYALPFVVLAAVGIVLYAIGMRVFEKKDLPL